jgi:hypothetical protein
MGRNYLRKEETEDKDKLYLPLVVLKAGIE